MAVEWIKVYLNMFDNPKLKLIDSMDTRDTIIYVWVRLLTEAGKTNDNGRIYISKNLPYTVKNLSVIFQRDEKIIKSALEVLSGLDMISIDENDIITITNWSTFQTMEDREKARQRMQRYRKKKKLEENSHGEEQLRNSCVTVTHKKEREEKEEVEELEVEEREKEEGESQKEKVSEKISESVIKILNHYESLTGKTGLFKFESLSLAVSIYGEHYVSLAIDKAIEAGKINMGYVNGILKNWASEGYPEEGGKVDGTGRSIKACSKFEGLEQPKTRELTPEEQRAAIELI